VFFGGGFRSYVLFHSMQIIAASKIVEEKQEILQPFNILPLDAAGSSQAIMQLPEVCLHVKKNATVKEIQLGPIF
jgi:hypothetical protein